jgi:hypothetical protein
VMASSSPYGDSDFDLFADNALVEQHAGVAPSQDVDAQQVQVQTNDLLTAPKSALTKEEMLFLEVVKLSQAEDVGSPGKPIFLKAELPVAEPFVSESLTISEGHCLLRGKTHQAMMEPSTCRHELRGLRQRNVVGCDPILNTSSEEITRFFLTHLKKPRVFVKIEGYHTVTTTRTSKGRTTTTEHRRTDFEYVCFIEAGSRSLRDGDDA